jgi:hypothetical protein
VSGWTFSDYGPESRAFNDEFIYGGYYKARATSSTSNGAALKVLYKKICKEPRMNLCKFFSREGPGLSDSPSLKVSFDETGK